MAQVPPIPLQWVGLSKPIAVSPQNCQITKTGTPILAVNVSKSPFIRSTTGINRKI